MTETLLIAVRTALVTLVLTGLVYPAVTTAAAQVLFHDRANGSLVKDERGNIVGSLLIAQKFTSPAYFHPRPSAAGSNGYDPMASGGSNLGPTSAALRSRVATEIADLTALDPSARRPIPVELVTASGSGLDPHLSPEAALWQAPRVARARGVAESRVEELVRSCVEGRDLGFLGEPRVNVLALNLVLDRRFGRPVGPAKAN